MHGLRAAAETMTLGHAWAPSAASSASAAWLSTHWPAAVQLLQQEARVQRWRQHAALQARPPFCPFWRLSMAGLLLAMRPTTATARGAADDGCGLFAKLRGHSQRLCRERQACCLHRSAGSGHLCLLLATWAARAAYMWPRLMPVLPHGSMLCRRAEPRLADEPLLLRQLLEPVCRLPILATQVWLVMPSGASQACAATVPRPCHRSLIRLRCAAG